MINIDKKFYTSKYDLVFKAIFCDDDNPYMMKCLLEDILKIKIEKIQFLNSELKVKRIKERKKIVDALVKVNDNIYINLEINSRKDRNIAFRNLVYFYHIIASKTLKSEKYDLNNQYIHIDFSYGLSSNKETEEEYKERNKTSKIEYIDNIKLIEFNMDKIVKFWYDKDEKKIAENKYLIMMNLEKEELEKLSKIYKGDEFIMKYKEKCEDINDEEYFTSFLSYEEDQRFLKNTYISEGERIGEKRGLELGEKRGEKRGLELGEKRGIELGEKRGLELGEKQGEIRLNNAKNEMARTMLKDGFSVEQVAKYTKLPKSSILNL